MSFANGFLSIFEIKIIEAMNLNSLKFPIGHFHYSENVSEEQRQLWIQSLAAFPQKIKEVTASLSLPELQYHYRPDGWNILQVVHHCADSHMNSYIRFKLALTEETPTIRPYEEQLWATLADGISENIAPSLQILDGVHQRWVQCLQSLTETDWERMYFHPANQKLVTLNEALGLYAWHGEHHLAHIHQALHYKGVFVL